MQVSLVITILGSDQPGLVKSLSETLNHFQGNWTKSSMSHLAGKFAGLVLVSVPTGQVDQLSSALQKLQSDSFQSAGCLKGEPMAGITVRMRFLRLLF